MKRTMRVGILSSIITVLVMVLFGCGGQGSESGDKVQITFSHWATGPEAKIYDDLIAVFEKEHPEIKVKQIRIPFDGYADKVQTMMAGRTEPDVMYMSHLWFPSFVERGAFLNLQPHIDRDNEFRKDDFHPVLAEAGKYRGDTYWIPRDLDYLVLFYNKDLFREAGVDFPNENWSWADLLNAAKKLTRDTNGDGRVDQYGILAPDGYIAFAWIWQNGGSVLNEERTQSLIDQPAATEAVQWISDLINQEKVAPSPQVTKQEGTSEMFKAGRVAMATYGHWLIPSLKEEKAFDWGVTLLPKGKAGRMSFVSGSGYTISKNTKHPDAAWKLVKWLNSPESQEKMSKLGLIVPSRKSVYESDTFMNTPENKVFVDQTKYLRELPVTTYWNEMFDVIQKEFTLVWMGDKSAAEATREIDRQVDAILKKRK